MERLPRGIIIDRGYVQVRIWHDRIMHCKNFGKDSPLARQLASIYLAERRKEALMGKVGIVQDLPSKTFREVADLWLEIWAKETDAEGKLKHSEKSVYNNRVWLDTLFIPFFGSMPFDAIRTIDVQRWRDQRVKVVLGTSANREQAILSSVFSHIEMWVKSGKIARAFKLPVENPSKHVEKAETRKRERIITPYECSKLKLSAIALGDEGAWDNIKLALKTCLSLNDLQKLRLGDTIDLNRHKTGVRVIVPITVLHQPDWSNWSKRWRAIVKNAGIQDIEFRDLRKSGGNLLLGRHDMKLVSQYLGHSEQKITESVYIKKHVEQMAVLADDINKIVESF